METEASLIGVIDEAYPSRRVKNTQGEANSTDGFCKNVPLYGKIHLHDLLDYLVKKQDEGLLGVFTLEDHWQTLCSPCEFLLIQPGFNDGRKG